MAVFRKERLRIPVASQGAKTSQMGQFCVQLGDERWRDGEKHLMSARSLYMHACTHEHMHVNMDIDMQTHLRHIYQNKRV